MDREAQGMLQIGARQPHSERSRCHRVRWLGASLCLENQPLLPAARIGGPSRETLWLRPGRQRTRSRQEGASRGFFFLSLSLFSAQSDPHPPPRGEARAASLHPLSKRSTETVAGASLEVPMELPSPQLPLACTSLSRSPLPPRPPSLKVQTRPKATAGAELAGQPNAPR
ncbi:unnamed protein product [Rangifer tarandus platyrhynchus]|uniref:Uncharacterized protein n=1 Tax=Rangifer tarandus platyrhynchus TaxID=3082113 RepID=A0AC59YDU4_RANTA